MFGRLSRSQQTRVVLYALTAVAALVLTQVHVIGLLPLGFVAGTVKFWTDTLANPSSRFITVDILFVFLVVWHWMLSEARQLQMRGMPGYFLGSLLIGFSVALPLFMLHREFAIARAKPEQAEIVLGMPAWLSTAGVGLGTLAYAWYACTLL
jgi:hypothetical protein